MSDTNIKDFVKAVRDQVIGWRRELHQYPELDMKTMGAGKIILRVLGEIGVDKVRLGIGGEDCHGMVAVIYGALPGKCLGIRADRDVPPILEKTGLSFASKNPGYMYACGHDNHTVMGLGAAKVLYRNRSKLKGTVKMIRQPGEEDDNRALRMIEGGVLENPKVGAVIDHHSDTSRSQKVALAQIDWTHEPSSFCITSWWAKFHGKSAYTAEPHLGVGPLLTVCYAVTELQVVLSREKRSNKPTIHAVSMFRAGGGNNVTPDTCCPEGSIRSGSGEDQGYYYQRLREIFQGAVKIMRCTAEIGYGHYLGATDNDPEVVKKLVPIMEKIPGKENVIEVKIAIPGREDFSGFTKRVPCVYYYHSGGFGDERGFPQHNSRFGLNEQTL